MSQQATCGISAPPEVVFSTATDPDRAGAWLPGGMRIAHGEARADTFEVQLTAGSNPAGVLRVQPGAAGGSSVDLSVADDTATTAEEMLRNLHREVSDNLNAG